MKATDIQGWMSEPELAWLEQTARQMQSIVEVGCWKGRSTVALASGCKGTVWAVDTWRDFSEDLKPHFTDPFAVFDEFSKNTARLRVMPVCVSSLEAIEYVPSVDMVFLDAGHTYREVLADIRAWRPKARKLICGHDADDDYPGVLQAVETVFGRAYAIPVGSIWTVWL